MGRLRVATAIEASKRFFFEKKNQKTFISDGVIPAVPRPLELHGHRGARGLWPENTVAGFVGALALGVTAIEMDVAVAADGVVVLSHDPVLPDGASLPRLDEVVCLEPQALLAIELKTFPDHPEWSVAPEVMADAVLAVLDRAGATTRARIISFDWRGLRYLRRIRPELSLGYLTDAETVAAARLWWDGASPEDFGGSVPRAVAAEGGTVWGPDVATLTPAEVEEAAGLGLLVNPWTVNEPAEMARLIGWGVGALTTDYPDRARAVMAQMGVKLLQARNSRR
jgi:glycerophosphoryl diester phosphodiesterase